jgi:hypothetical protein
MEDWVSVAHECSFCFTPTFKIIKKKGQKAFKGYHRVYVVEGATESGVKVTEDCRSRNGSRSLHTRLYAPYSYNG